MSFPFSQVGIIVKHTITDPIGMIKVLAADLTRAGATVWYGEKTAARLPEDPPGLSRQELREKADLVIVLGGDGTILSVARDLVGSGIPILGINIGELGFLTETPLEQSATVTDHLARGRYVIENRMMLRCVARRGGEVLSEHHVLNDVVVSRRALARILDLDLYMDDGFVSSYRTDGLLLATPTGSTAYNLAAGGPLIVPTMAAIVVSPIAPHSLTARPLVIADTARLEVRFTGGAEDIYCTLDGQEGVALTEEDVVEVSKSPEHTPLIRFPENQFFTILRAKLRWGER